MMIYGAENSGRDQLLVHNKRGAQHDDWIKAYLDDV